MKVLALSYIRVRRSGLALKRKTSTVDSPECLIASPKGENLKGDQIVAITMVGAASTDLHVPGMETIWGETYGLLFEGAVSA